jgi:O-methyltransferase involved in polyketide biosynthesis
LEQSAPELRRLRTPNVARIYDYLLGGKDNFEEDRSAARQLLDAVPDAAVAAWDNREFLGRAVRFLAEEAGIRQFIDIGTGLPTRGSVHAIVEQSAPASRVVYVDYDPVVIDHAQALLAEHPNVIAINGDLRQPGLVLADPAIQRLIDFDQPVAILLVAILHFVKDEESPGQILSQLRNAMAPGSYLALSHVTSDGVPPAAIDRVRKLYEQATAPGVPRNYADISALFDGLELIPPGVVNVASWRADWMATEPGRTIFFVGVGRKNA